MDTDIKPTLDAAKEQFETRLPDGAFVPGKREWVPSTAAVADYFINVLPPIYGRGCFACSEPYSDNERGEPVYLTFRDVNYFLNTAEAKYCTRREITSGSLFERIVSLL